MANGKGQTAVTSNRYASVITLESREAAIAARGQTPRQVQPGSGYFAGSSAELAPKALPKEAFDASLLTGAMNGAQIGVLGEIGGRGLSAMPGRAEVRLLSADHSLAAGKDGVYAVYYTDHDGRPCKTPLLLDNKGWAALFSDAVPWDAHCEQPFPYLANDFYLRAGQRVGNGHTFLLDLVGTDRSGQPFSEGVHRFFVPRKEYTALVAPMQKNSIAHKTLMTANKGKLPASILEFDVLSAQLALADNPRIPYVVLVGYLRPGVVMSAPAKESEVRSDLLDPRSFKDAVARLAEIREMNALNAEEAKQRQAGTFGSTAAAEAMEEGSLVTDEMPTI